MMVAARLTPQRENTSPAYRGEIPIEWDFLPDGNARLRAPTALR